MPSKKTLHVGLIGYNFMGKAHSNAWRQAPRFFNLPADVRLHTICGRSPEAVEKARAQLGWEFASTDWRAVVGDPEIDIVDICTPNDSHAEIAIEAARQGKAILCEKPLAMDVAECQAMADAAKKARVVNMVCHNYRRIPAIALAKRMIEEGAIGDRIYHYRARYAQDWIADPNFPLVWRLQSKIAGSGTHGDIDAHIIDLGRYLVGEVKEVCGLMETFIKERPLQEQSGAGLSAKGGQKMGRVTVDDAVSWIGRFKNGAIANLEATRFALGRKNHITLEINGSKGSLAFNFEDMNRLDYFNHDDPEDRRGFRSILVTEATQPYAGAWWPPGHIIGYEHTFVNTFADFVAAVVAGKSVQPTFEDGLINEKVLAAISESAKTRRWVKV
ncbi:MAG TPA: Gfo/Idh/MocA family oxidoreductase [Chthoniobacteraceae bacterium]|jgi:predicted dehydrogenase|nr:Gfo/Idh/MocA family oxidoreductase [Chthoniobacteraceae bacterium]